MTGCWKGLRGAKVAVEYIPLIKALWGRFELSAWTAEFEADTLDAEGGASMGPIVTWARTLPVGSAAHIANRLKREKEVEENPPELPMPSSSLAITVGTDKLRLAGDGIMINLDSEDQAPFRIFSDCGPNRGFLLWDMFLRRIRALGYMQRTRSVAASPDLDEKLCDLDETEILRYVTRFIEEEKRAQSTKQGTTTGG